ncbi:MAG TPA: PHB depolymerase family esterase [Sandaracinaceae bacterium LLY-WYZ-13_1]|nr:PHB depolymerase family esterase [Sandaracinaceae bacterium LLY-WYZ-13_1]
MRRGWLVGALVLSTGMGAPGCGDSSMVDEADAAAPVDAGPPWVRDAGPPEPPDPIDLPEPAPSPEPDPPPPDPEPFSCEGGRDGPVGRRLHTLTHDGLLRTTYLHVPEAYDPSEGTMLVLNFHGFSSADWQQALLTRMGEEADARGFVVAYPQGVAVSWNAGDCCGTAWADAVDDVGFVEALIDELSEAYCIDPRRIFATGMSNGGFFSHRLACELSERIAAIAPVAGVLGVEPESCAPPRPVPVWQFHGTEDGLVPYEGGTPVVPELGAGLVFRSVDETMAHWAARDGCESTTTPFYENGDVTCVGWDGCEAPVRLCTVDGGGHTWPGGLPVPFLGRTTRDVDATDAMLDFFAANPMPPAP